MAGVTEHWPCNILDALAFRSNTFDFHSVVAFLIRTLVFSTSPNLAFPLFAGHTVAGVTDHWPSDYEQKVRRAALDLGRLKKATTRDERENLTTTNMARALHI